MANAKYFARSAPLNMHLQLAQTPHFRLGFVIGCAPHKDLPDLFMEFQVFLRIFVS